MQCSTVTDRRNRRRTADGTDGLHRRTASAPARCCATIRDRGVQVRELAAADSTRRSARYTDDRRLALHLDLSKNLITAETLYIASRRSADTMPSSASDNKPLIRGDRINALDRRARPRSMTALPTTGSGSDGDSSSTVHEVVAEVRLGPTSGSSVMFDRRASEAG